MTENGTRAVSRDSYLKDWIYGGIDGSITTLAVIAGVGGANLSIRVIIVLGFANIVADGFSMAASNFMSVKAEHEQFTYYKTSQERQLLEAPESQRKKIQQLYQKKGFSGTTLEEIVAKVTSDESLWIRTILQEIYGLAYTKRSAIKAALCTFSAFVVCGLVPLIPFLLNLSPSFPIAYTITGATFFGIGSIKSYWTTESWWMAGLKSLLIGGIAAALAFYIGQTIEAFA